MTGDYTRITFRPDRHFSSVRLQQGRVQLDADWNEAADIGLHVDRTTTLDVVGPTGVPEDAAGFALTPADPDGDDAASDLLIGTGRAYVRGILVEHLPSAPTTLSRVSGSPNNFRVEAGPVPRLGDWLVGAADPARVVAVPAPVASDTGRVRVVLDPAPAGATVTAVLTPSVGAQPDLDGDPVPEAAGTYGVWLEVVEREVTALDDPYLRETALGGPDTCLRTQVVWRVRAGAGASCLDFPPDWHPDPAARARLVAEGVPALADDDPCLTPDPGGYRGIDNRLYRVEVHRGGVVEDGDVLVKWSRDNAIHRTRYTVVAGRLRVESLGKDDVVALDQGQWVELRDEAAWRAGRPGPMVRLGEVNGLEIAVDEVLDAETNAPLTDAEGNPQTAALPTGGRLRRWEGGAPVALAVDTALPLESGIQATVGSGALRPGEAWTIPARALVADVEWPRDPANGAPLAVPPHTGTVHVMPLAVVERTAAGRLRLVSDCRRLFAPLTAQIAFQMLGGDGQEALVDPTDPAALTPLAAPLRVGVARGRTPVAGRRVRFRTLDGSNPARLDAVPGTPAARVLVTTPTELVIVTDDDGVAEARCGVHAGRTAYAVEARLLDADEPALASPVHLPIHFFAAAEVASEVAFDPANCLYQRETPSEDGPATTVQDAIDRLCPQIQFLPLGGDGQMVVPGEPFPAPLRVGLLWGGRPLAGVRVRFEVATGNAGPATVEATTGPDGVATASFTAGNDAGVADGVIRIRASASDLPQTSWPEQLQFAARFARGGEADRPRLRIEEVLFVGPNGTQPMRAGMPFARETVAQGFLVRLDEPASQVLERNWMVGEVWIDLPLLVTGSVPDPSVPTGRLVVAGGVPFRPDGLWFREGDFLVWQFTEVGRRWVLDVLPGLMAQANRDFVTARLVIHGNHVFGDDRAPRWLDGTVLFGEDGTVPLLPSGVGVPGSTFRFPFLIGGRGFEPGRGNVSGPGNVVAPGGPPILGDVVIRDDIVRGGGFVVVPVIDAPVVADLGQPARLVLGRGLDAALDRTALTGAGLVDTGAVRGARTVDTTLAARTIGNLAAAPRAPLRVLVRTADRQLFEAMRGQVETATGVTLEPVVTRATTADTFASMLSADDGPELAFAEAAFLEEVRASRQLTRALGEPLLAL